MHEQEQARSAPDQDSEELDPSYPKPVCPRR